MDVFQSRYYGLNRFVLRIFGLWRYDNWRNRMPKLILPVSLLLIGTVGLVTKDRTSFYFLMLCIDIMVAFFTRMVQLLVPGIAGSFNTLYMCYHSNKVNMVIKHIIDDWNLHAGCDLEIMKRYAELMGSFISITTMCCSVFCMTQLIKVVDRNTGFMIKDSEPPMPTPQTVPLIGDPKLKIYAVCFSAAVISIGHLVAVGIGNMCCISTMHACVMFHILGQRFENVFDSMDHNVLYNKGHSFSELFRLIFYHIRALEFVGLINSLYGTTYIILVGLVIGVVSCDVLVSFGTDSNLFISTVGNSIGLLVAVFVHSLAGQLLLDQSRSIVGKIYASRWYTVPPTIQRSIVLVMVRGQMDCGIVMTKTISASYEMFLAVVKLSYSYFMTLKSLQPRT